MTLSMNSALQARMTRCSTSPFAPSFWRLGATTKFSLPANHFLSLLVFINISYSYMMKCSTRLTNRQEAQVTKLNALAVSESGSLYKVYIQIQTEWKELDLGQKLFDCLADTAKLILATNLALMGASKSDLTRLARSP